MKVILEKIVESSKKSLGDNLSGVYLHGSAALGCYNPAKSDIDFIVTVKNPPSLGEKMNFIREILEIDKIAPEKGLETSVVLEKYCRDFVYPTPFELHFSSSHKPRCISDLEGYCRGMRGTDKDLAAHFTVIKQSGIALYGEAVGRMFCTIPEEYYIDSVMYDIGEARENIHSEPVYTVLNLARSLMYFTDGFVRSKKQGGEDVREIIPPKFKTLVERALEDYTGEKTASFGGDSILTEYADYMLDIINKKIVEFNNKDNG